MSTAPFIPCVNSAGADVWQPAVAHPASCVVAGARLVSCSDLAGSGASGARPRLASGVGPPGLTDLGLSLRSRRSLPLRLCRRLAVLRRRRSSLPASREAPSGDEGRRPSSVLGAGRRFRDLSGCDADMLD